MLWQQWSWNQVQCGHGFCIPMWLLRGPTWQQHEGEWVPVHCSILTQTGSGVGSRSQRPSAQGLVHVESGDIQAWAAVCHKVGTQLPSGCYGVLGLDNLLVLTDTASQSTWFRSLLMSHHGSDRGHHSLEAHRQQVTARAISQHPHKVWRVL